MWGQLTLMAPWSCKSLWLMILPTRSIYPETPLWFWTHFSDKATGYIPFEKKLLACHWDLVDTEHLTYEGLITLQTDNPMLGWAYSDSTPNKVWRAQQALTCQREIFKNATSLAQAGFGFTWRNGTVFLGEILLPIILPKAKPLGQWNLQCSEAPLNDWAWFTDGPVS